MITFFFEENDDNVLFGGILDHVEENHDVVESLGLANIAGKIEASIEKNSKFNCNDCSNVFEYNPKIDIRFFVSNKKCYTVQKHF